MLFKLPVDHCNLSKNPKEKKDQQLAEDEDLDDVLKKSSNTNTDVSLILDHPYKSCNFTAG